MKNIYITYLIVVAFFSTSCSGFLDEDNKAGVGAGYYDTEEGIEAGVRSCYSYLKDMYTMATYSGELGTRLLEYGTDTQIAGAGYSGPWVAYAINSNAGEVRTFWEKSYQMINGTNAIIAHMPNVEGKVLLNTQEKKNIRLGETRFFRALTYYRLALTFGDVPLKLDETTESISEFKRSPAKDIYNQAIEDLIFAEEYLPNTTTEHGRVTKAAAQHLLAKVYLTRVSCPSEARGGENADLDKAIEYGERLINAGHYKLEANINNVFKYDGNKVDNSEFILVAKFSKDPLLNGQGNVSHMMWGSGSVGMDNYLVRTVETGVSWIKMRPSKYLLKSYDLRYDSRFYKWFRSAWTCNKQPANPLFAVGDTIIQYVMVDKHNDIPGSIINSKLHQNGKVYAIDDFTERDFPSTLKHVDPFRETFNSQVGYRDEPIFRIAETYLIVAEAYGRKEDYVNAAKYINAVRQRAAYKDNEVKPEVVFTVHGLPVGQAKQNTINEMKITTSDINSTEKLVDFILDEYARELNAEYGRWYELVRTGTWYDRVSKYTKDVYYGIKPYHRFRPIPQSHIDRLTNKGPIEEEQNVGYY